jgi:hypothetical protein
LTATAIAAPAHWQASNLPFAHVRNFRGWSCILPIFTSTAEFPQLVISLHIN